MNRWVVFALSISALLLFLRFYRWREGSRPIGHFYTKIAGVTHQNQDGVDRQQLIEKYREKGNPVLFIPEPDNEFDPNALKVCVAGEQLGYINSDLAKKMTAMMHKGQNYYGFISDITGGEKRKKTMGANLLIVYSKKEISTDELLDYIDSNNGEN